MESTSNFHFEIFNLKVKSKDCIQIKEINLYFLTLISIIRFISVVISIPDCRIAMGKSWFGLELSQRRKSLWMLSICSCSTILSSCGIQLSDRWRLARKTQLPVLAPPLIRLVATTAKRQAVKARTHVVLLGPFRYLFVARRKDEC